MSARPHRRSKLVEAPDGAACVPREALEELAPAAALLPPAALTSGGNGNGGNGKTPWTADDVREHLAAWGLETTKDYAKDGAAWWEIAVCPFNPEHKRNVYVSLDPAKGILAGCNHNSCDWTWTELRARFDADYAARQAEAGTPAVKAKGDPRDAAPPHVIPVDEDGVPLPDAPSAPEGFDLRPLDWQALLRDGVPEVEYISAPYLPRGARIWVFGKAGTMKSLWCEHEAARLSRAGVRVSYFSEENPIAEELRRLDRLQPDPAHFRLFHRTGMDLADEKWVAAMLAVTRGDDLAVFDSWTDLWSGNEDSNREIQQFDTYVLKPLQWQGVTPVVIHHRGHGQMFGGDRSGNDAGRGGSALGQKADVTLTFKDAGDDRFTIVYGKARLGGIHVPECGFKVEDTDDGRVEISECMTPITQSIAELAEKAIQAVLTVPAGYLTTTMLREAIGGAKDLHSAALKQAEMDPRVHVATEQVVAADGVKRRAKVWRPTREGLPL